jgi:adenine-specific DNA-methyltransferase
MSTEIDGRSLDLRAEKISRLRSIFPELFAEGRVDFGRLRDLLGDEPAAPDHYELSWAGKAQARREIQRQTTATLAPDRAGSVNFDASENIFIEGENLEVLRVLQKSYFGKIRMVYIDPPYNTGHDCFVYPDDFAERLAEYERRAGLRDDEGFLNRLDLFRQNTKESGQYHSVWLSMMYPRLYLARNLLREDGVIFVSVDDSEQANLKLLMDEVFGAENFFAMLTRRAMHTVRNSSKDFNVIADYVLVYGKNKSWFAEKKERYIRVEVDKTEHYPHDDADGKGRYKLDPLSARNYYTPYKYTFRNGVEWEAPAGSYPRYSPDTLAEKEARGEIVFTGAEPKAKRYLKDVQVGRPPDVVLRPEDVDFNSSGTSEVKSLFDGNGGIFSQPKPSRLIIHLLKILRDKNALVLDFFAGSGSTAHAVLALNREDGGRRRFICVQMPEPTGEGSEPYKAGYRTIADITRARIRRVIERIGGEGGLASAGAAQDSGFRSYKLAPSNFKQWRAVIGDQADLLRQLATFTEPLAGRPADSYALLVELMLKAGLPLTAGVERRESGDGLPYFVLEGGRLVFALDRLGDELLSEVERLRPRSFVTLGNLFEGARADESLTNWKLRLKEAGTELKVI